MTRQEALSLNVSHYFTGKPCKYGHFSLRRVSDTNCMECEKLRLRKEYQNPPERKRRLNSCKEWSNKNKQYVKDYISKWQKDNPGIVKAHSAKYRAKLLERTPCWADLDKITEFYKCCPEGFHVDHVIPLQGKFVSGLHVFQNLQYLTQSDNCKKHNSFEVK